MVKNLTVNTGDAREDSLIPGSGRSPGGGNCTPISLPGEFHGQGSLVGYSPWGHKELDITEQLGKDTHTKIKGGYWLFDVHLVKSWILSIGLSVWTSLSIVKKWQKWHHTSFWAQDFQNHQLLLLVSWDTPYGVPGHHGKSWTALRIACWRGHVYTLTLLVSDKHSCSFIPAKAPDTRVKPFWTFQTSPSASRMLMSGHS